MIVHRNNRRGSQIKRSLNDFSGKNAGGIDRPAKQLFVADEPVPWLNNGRPRMFVMEARPIGRNESSFMQKALIDSLFGDS